MELHVLTYGFCDNPDGLPADWPALVKEKPENTPLAPDWQRFTHQEYQDYVAAHHPAYEAAMAGKWLAQSQASAWDAIKTYRDSRQGKGVPVGPYWFHSDADSRIKYLGLLLLGANIPANLQWKTMTRSFVTMTPTLAQQVFGSLAAFDTATFAQAEIHRAAMMQSAAPLLYDFSSGWPPVYGE